MLRFGALCAATATLAAWAADRASAQQHPGASSDAAAARPIGYTAAQAQSGHTTYEQNCAACHGAALDGGGGAPALSGPAFARKWAGKSAEGLFSVIRSMPPGKAASLRPEQSAALLAFILQANGAPAGRTPAPATAAELAGTSLPGGAPAKTADVPPPEHNTRLAALRPVDAETLKAPPPQDWLSWRRTYDASGFSPLDQINRDNVDRLQVAWSWSLPPGGNMMAPIVRDGVLYAYSFGDVVEALDAATGELLWSYQHPLKADVTPQGKKGVALAGDEVLVPTSDMHVVALNARTGAVMWDHAIDVGSETKHQIKSAPLVADGKVVIGVNGFQEVKGGNFIVALDLATGSEVWRFHTVAGAGDPGADSWNGVPPQARSGGSVWVGGSYDPTRNLVYYGVGQTYDTVPLRPKPGATRDNRALYTDSTVALDAATGRLVWFFQHQPDDQLDHDWAFEQILAPLELHGQRRPSVITAGKDAIFDVLDAGDGRYGFSMDMGLQNVVASIDPVTGAKRLNPAAMPTGDKIPPRYTPPGVCPDLLGARNLMAGAYDPGSRVLFMPLTDTCVYPFPNGKRWEKTPDAADDAGYGVLKAIDLDARKVVWTTRTRGPFVSAALATGGGLVFAGTVDRRFKAFDARTGRELWDAGVDNAPTSYPATYAVDGRQYVAVATSEGFVQAQAMEQVAKVRPPPDGGATLWVFALPATRKAVASR